MRRGAGASAALRVPPPLLEQPHSVGSTGGSHLTVHQEQPLKDTESQSCAELGEHLQFLLKKGSLVKRSSSPKEKAGIKFSFFQQQVSDKLAGLGREVQKFPLVEPS